MTSWQIAFTKFKAWQTHTQRRKICGKFLAPPNSVWLQEDVGHIVALLKCFGIGRIVLPLWRSLNFGERDLITGSAVALHCCKAHSKINRKMEISTPCKILTPENFILKLGTRDYIENVTYYANFGVDRFSGGFSPNRWNITLLWLFFLSCPVLSCPSFFFSITRPARTTQPIFALYGSNDVAQPKDSPFWG